MKVKDFKPDAYFSHEIESEMTMADAIYYGEKKLVRDYINTGRVDINRPGKVGFTFLMYAVYIEQYDVAKVLLENGADPNILSIVTETDTGTCAAAEAGYRAPASLYLSDNMVLSPSIFQYHVHRMKTLMTAHTMFPLSPAVP